MASRADENPLITVRRAAMNLLARREQSFHELITKLTQKYPDFDKSDVILPALEKLRDENLQSDERFVEAYIRYRRTRGHGPLKIEMELRQKGVNDNLISGGVHADDINWKAHCHDALLKKFGHDDLVSQKVREKCYRFLSQRGFDGEQIKAAMAGKIS
jgi:regulatory protein